MSDSVEFEKLNHKIAEAKSLVVELEAAAQALKNNEQHDLIDSLQSLDDAAYRQAVNQLSLKLHDELHQFTDKIRAALKLGGQ